MQNTARGHIVILFLVLLIVTFLILQHDTELNFQLKRSGQEVVVVEDNTNEATLDRLGYPSQLLNETVAKHLITRKNRGDFKKYSILPKKIYTVIGLESSGTQFVAGIIRDALNLHAYREGSFSYANITDEALDVQVQHFSLPWGSTCQSHPDVPIVDVVLPSQCTRTSKENIHGEECSKMGNDLWGKATYGGVEYPERYNLDIVSHKEWYDAQGVEQYFVIVIRDGTISKKARKKVHCTDYSLLLKLEEVGRDIIIDAINRYVLESHKTGKKVTRENYKYWEASTFSGTGRKLSAGLVKGNNVVLVSYETLMMLKQPYVEMMYDALDIQSTYVPTIKDGNAKYVVH